MLNALKISGRTPVYDHAGELLFIATRERAQQLIAEHKVDILGNRVRIRGLRICGPDPALRGRAVRRELGLPHQRETYFNPKGAWHLDSIPQSLRRDFQAVVASCTGS